MSTHQDWRDVRACLETPSFLEFNFCSSKDARYRLERFTWGIPRSCYALIHNLPNQGFEYFGEIMKGTRIDYYRHLELAVLYLKWPSYPHNYALPKFRTLFSRKAHGMGISDFGYTWLPRSHDGSRRSKQADECFFPSQFVQRGSWPALVIEVGLLETMGQLRQDSLWWFSESPNVKYVLLIALDITAKEITIEKWERGRPPSGRATRSSTAASNPSATETVTINESGVVGTLRLSFERLFGVQPGPTEHDFEFKSELVFVTLIKPRIDILYGHGATEYYIDDPWGISGPTSNAPVTSWKPVALTASGKLFLGENFTGPRLSGKILDVGADWHTADPRTNVFSADTRYNLQTNDGANIFIRTEGPKSPSGQLHLRLIFGTGSEKYYWVNNIVAIGVLTNVEKRADSSVLKIDAWNVNACPL